jgi:hypothetical protein
MKLMITCRQSARLISEELDRELPWSERAVLRMHLLICRACPRFRAQIRLVDSAVGRWRTYVDQGD